jgi:hydroxymethylbilane synthase
MKHKVCIGTRGSQLALWQARWVKDTIERQTADISVELMIIKTKGDKILDVPLARVGGKGLFVKEIEEALMDGRIDMAVHSMKDMPSELPEGLTIGAIPQRENPQDVLVAKRSTTLDSLPQKAMVGTSSLRRGAQLKHLRPDLVIAPLRGNLDTRLKKLTDSSMEAIVLAAAGMHRLQLAEKITAYLPVETMLPAVGQGALCIEQRADDPVIGPLLRTLDHTETRIAVTAERAFLHRLEGGCQVPIAAHGQLNDGALTLKGRVADPEGRQMLVGNIQGPPEEAVNLGKALAEDLLNQGADKILERLNHNVH